MQGDEARHIRRVLRLQPGDPIALFDEHGTAYSGVIQSFGARTVEVALTRRDEPQPHEEMSALILAQAVLKSDKMDFVVQKCTELGVTCIAPFVSTRTVPRWPPGVAAQKTAHWRRIVIAAIKQSGIRRPPDIEQPVAFEELLRRGFDGCLKIILWEQETDVTLKQVLRSHQTPQGIVVAVGPEGGFTHDEIVGARSSGFITAGLGSATLRAETAAIAVLAMIRYEQMQESVRNPHTA